MKKTIITSKAGNYNAIAYWCNALGETHCRGRFDIKPGELPAPLRDLFWKVWDTQYGFPCYLVDTEDGFGIALVALYDDEMAEKYGLSMDAMFQAAVKDMEDLAASTVLENAHAFLMENSDPCGHELAIIMPADTARLQMQQVAARMEIGLYHNVRVAGKKQLNQQEPIKKDSPSAERLANMLRSYVNLDVQGSSPKWVSEVLRGTCGMTKEEAEQLGMSWVFDYDYEEDDE
jgi:hypothetical protein